jgi:hypothetical protein
MVNTKMTGNPCFIWQAGKSFFNGVNSNFCSSEVRRGVANNTVEFIVSVLTIS